MLRRCSTRTCTLEHSACTLTPTCRMCADALMLCTPCSRAAADCSGVVALSVKHAQTCCADARSATAATCTPARRMEHSARAYTPSCRVCAAAPMLCTPCSRPVAAGGSVDVAAVAAVMWLCTCAVLQPVRSLQTRKRAHLGVCCCCRPVPRPLALLCAGQPRTGALGSCLWHRTRRRAAGYEPVRGWQAWWRAGLCGLLRARKRRPRIADHC